MTVQAAIFSCAATALAAILGYSSGQESAPGVLATQAGPEPTSLRPMAAFSRLLGGRWKMTTAAGRDTFDTWSWGPGEQSIRSMRVGTLTDGDPWSTMTVYYWHPTLKEVRLLSVGSVMRGVGEGNVKFEGDNAQSIFKLHQTGGPRDLRDRWTFAGPDKYHDELSEKVRDDYELLTGWDRHRVETAKIDEKVAVPFLLPGSTPSEFMRPLEKVLGDAWASIVAMGADSSPPAEQPRTRTKFEYVPHADAIYGRVEVIDAGARPLHALDVYLYHHTGTQALRALALGDLGPNGATVYEGDIVPAPDCTSLAIRLTEHRATGQRELEARVEFEEGGTARVQVWRLQGQERTMVMDRRHQRTRE